MEKMHWMGSTVTECHVVWQFLFYSFTQDDLQAKSESFLKTIFMILKLHDILWDFSVILIDLVRLSGTFHVQEGVG